MKKTRCLIACLAVLLAPALIKGAAPVSGKIPCRSDGIPSGIAAGESPAQKPACTASYGRGLSRSDIPRELDRKILYTIKAAQRMVYDMDRDGKVNCIDYTLMFKTQWDKSYPQNAGSCEIVRNLKKGRMNHLFISIWTGSRQRILVEPWAYDPELYLMEENWDWRYDPRYNIYGETARWMGEIVSR